MQEAADININNIATSQVSLYSAEDIIILSDGICSSACSVFMELMHHQAQVRTVVVGGKPDYTPMQAPSGTRGAASYGTSAMDIDIKGARRVDNSTTALPADRTHAFYIDQASVNLRDQIRYNDSSNIPWQFQFEQADCRIFFTPKTWYNFTNLWNYAAHATWHNTTLCVVKSADLTKPRNSDTPSVAQVATGVPASQGEPSSESDTRQHDDNNASIHPILDSSKFFQPLLGKPCKEQKDCDGRYTCEWVDRYNPKSPICTRPCSLFSNVGLASMCGELGARCSTLHLNDEFRVWAMYHGNCVPKDRNQWQSNGENPGLQSKSRFLETDTAVEDDVATPSCISNPLFQNAFVHCFNVRNTPNHRCLHYTKLDTPSLKSDDQQHCADAELEKWKEDATLLEHHYDHKGAKGYLKPDPDALGPYYIVFHGEENLNDFRHLFRESKLAECTSWHKWPIYQRKGCKATKHRIRKPGKH